MFRAGSSGTCQDPETNRSPLRSGPRRARNFQSSGNSTRPCRLKDLESPAFRLTRFGVDCPQTSNTRPEKSRPRHRVFFPCCRRCSGPLCSMKVTQSLARNHLGPLWIAGIGVRSSLASGTTVRGSFFAHFQGSSPFSHKIILDPQDVRGGQSSQEHPRRGRRLRFHPRQSASASTSRVCRSTSRTC